MFPHKSSKLNTALLCAAGDLLIIMAQIIVAVQMVLEEKFVYRHDVHPLKAVGTEGKAAVIRFRHLSFSLQEQQKENFDLKLLVMNL